MDFIRKMADCQQCRKKAALSIFSSVVCYMNSVLYE